MNVESSSFYVYNLLGDIMKKFIIIVFLALLSGLLFLYSYVFIHKVSYGDIPILTYHGIDNRDNEYYLDPDKFEEMIA